MLRPGCGGRSLVISLGGVTLETKPTPLDDMNIKRNIISALESRKRAEVLIVKVRTQGVAPYLCNALTLSPFLLRWADRTQRQQGHEALH